MKNLIYAIIAMATTGFLFTSCDKKEPYVYPYIDFITIGELQSQNQTEMKILSDKGNKVTIINRASLNGSIDLTRVVALGRNISSTVDGDVNSYTIEASDVFKILTKESVSLKEITADKELADLIGNDYIYPGSYMISSIDSKYFNINFAYPVGGNGTVQYINLVMEKDSDEITPDADGELKLMARLSRKSNSQYRNYVKNSFVSFDIEKYMLIPGVKSITIELEYEKFGNVSETVTTTWKSDAEADGKESIVIEGNTISDLEISKNLK